MGLGTRLGIRIRRAGRPSLHGVRTATVVVARSSFRVSQHFLHLNPSSLIPHPRGIHQEISVGAKARGT